MSELVRSVARGSARLAAGQYTAAALGLAATAAAARLLGPTDFGIVALAMAYPELITSALAVKSSSVTTRYLAVFHADRRFEDLGAICKVAIALDTAAYALAAGIVVLSSGMVARVFYGSSELAPLMVLYALWLPLLGGVPTALATLSVTGRFGSLAAIHVAESGLRLVLIVALVMGGFGAAGAVAAAAVAQGTGAIAKMMMASWALRQEGVEAWWRAPVSRITWLRKDLGAMVGWNYLMVTLSGVMGQLPLMWLGQIRGPEEAGFFKLATTIMTIVTHVEGALGRVVSPILATAVGGKTPAELSSLTRAWTLKLGLPLVGGIALSMTAFPFVVSIVFGNHFAGAVRTIQLVVAGTLVSGVLFWVPPYYFALGRVGSMTRIYAAGVVLALGAAWLAITHVGVMGLAAVVAAERAGFALALRAMVRSRSRGREGGALTLLHRPENQTGEAAFPRGPLGVEVRQEAGRANEQRWFAPPRADSPAGQR